MGTIVVGYVPKPEGRAALRRAAEEARLRDAPPGGRQLPPRRPRVRRRRRHRVRGRELEEVRAELREAGVEHEVRQLVRGMDPADDLVNVADEVDAEFIVIGLRRRSPVGKLILGSNAQRVLLDAPCPVLAVKADEESTCPRPRRGPHPWKRGCPCHNGPAALDVNGPCRAQQPLTRGSSCPRARPAKLFPDVLGHPDIVALVETGPLYRQVTADAATHRNSRRCDHAAAPQGRVQTPERGRGRRRGLRRGRPLVRPAGRAARAPAGGGDRRPDGQAGHGGRDRPLDGDGQCEEGGGQEVLDDLDRGDGDRCAGAGRAVHAHRPPHPGQGPRRSGQRARTAAAGTRHASSGGRRGLPERRGPGGRRHQDPARPPRRDVREGPRHRPDAEGGGGREQGLRRLPGRRVRRAGPAGHGGRRHRRPGQGLPQADRQGPAAQRREGGRARQAHRGRPVLRGEARQGRQDRREAARASSSGSPRTAAARRTTCSRPTSGSWSRWPSATPAAACCSST